MVLRHFLLRSSVTPTLKVLFGPGLESPAELLWFGAVTGAAFVSVLVGFGCLSSSLWFALPPILDPNDDREFLAEAIREEAFPELPRLGLVSVGLDGVASEAFSCGDVDDELLPNILARMPPELERVRRLPASFFYGGLQSVLCETLRSARCRRFDLVRE